MQHPFKKKKCINYFIILNWTGQFTGHFAAIIYCYMEKQILNVLNISFIVAGRMGHQQEQRVDGSGGRLFKHINGQAVLFLRVDVLNKTWNL